MIFKRWEKMLLSFHTNQSLRYYASQSQKVSWLKFGWYMQRSVKMSFFCPFFRPESVLLSLKGSFKRKELSIFRANRCVFGRTVLPGLFTVLKSFFRFPWIEYYIWLTLSAFSFMDTCPNNKIWCKITFERPLTSVPCSTTLPTSLIKFVPQLCLRDVKSDCSRLNLRRVFVLHSGSARRRCRLRNPIILRSTSWCSKSLCSRSVIHGVALWRKSSILCHLR